MKIEVVRALSDNFMYLIYDEVTKEGVVVDPVDVDKIGSHISRLGVRVRAVLTTHWHGDHAGGNEEFVGIYRGTPVYGGGQRVSAVTNVVRHGEELTVSSMKIKFLYTPCHTVDHVCYYISDNAERVVFTGDTLFIGGCGKFFEGQPIQMYTALIEILGNLPDDTKVYCGHEYTVQNLKFAKNVEPDNPHISEKLSWAENEIRMGNNTVPSTIGEEKLYNPFMRVQERSVQQYVDCLDPVNVMLMIRMAKNRFRADD